MWCYIGVPAPFYLRFFLGGFKPYYIFLRPFIYLLLGGIFTTWVCVGQLSPLYPFRPFPKNSLPFFCPLKRRPTASPSVFLFAMAFPPSLAAFTLSPGSGTFLTLIASFIPSSLPCSPENHASPSRSHLEPVSYPARFFRFFNFLTHFVLYVIFSLCSQSLLVVINLFHGDCDPLFTVVLFFFIRGSPFFDDSLPPLLGVCHLVRHDPPLVFSP